MANEICKRCTGEYDVMEAAAEKEAAVKKIGNKYNADITGLCPSCALIVLSGYDVLES